MSANQIFYISDTHFAHPAIARARGFPNAKAHDEVLLADWKRRVSKTDTVYIVGDLFAYRANPCILEELTGRLLLICGNHEKHWLKQIQHPEQWFHQIVDDSLEITDDGRRVVMSHCPCPERCASEDRETYYLHGHLHDQPPRREDWARFCSSPRVLNVGADIARHSTGSWAPAKLEEWVFSNLKPMPK